ncbi:hypothetical protein [Chryseobacterium sp. HSC-36S06]|uniref:hypothetical protein n=1 Tax=Chryseobacterium sp. HSC-36S06 TaxID=2910970 RepID=UPI00209E10FC|nr:hypothetical protein [Chryseobacterium sp. HSC-36S06]MCP2037851.1 hypothetical protein [Chryseobacterium sp. HSC-36S06]
MEHISKTFHLQLFFVLSYILLCVSSVELIIDDAYITFQYAKNLAHFGKPWYNLDPTFQGNGQTSILWMAILAGLNFTGLKVEYFFMVINIGVGSFLIIKLVEFLQWKNIINIESVFNLSLTVFFVLWLYFNSLHGLETVLSCYILYLLFKNWDKEKYWFMLILPFVRPEFILFLLFWSIDVKLFSKEFFRRIFYVLTTIGIYILYYLIFFDFHILLPFLYKSEFKTYTLQQFFVYFGLLLIFFPVIFSLLNRRKFLILVPLNIFLFYYTFNVQSYSSGIFTRYYFPLMSLYLVFPIYISFHFRYFNKIAKVILKLLMIFAIGRMFDLSNNFLEQKRQIANENVGYYGSYAEVVKLLSPQDKIIVNDAGFTAYFANATCYDGVGLNDATIMLARKNMDANAYRDYIEDKKINYVTVVSLNPEKFISRSPAEDFIFKTLHLENLKPFRIFPMDKGYYLFLYYFPQGYHRFNFNENNFTGSEYYRSPF